jgi:hypothetical protein
MNISELWEEVITYSAQARTSFTFIRATDTEPTTPLKKMAERFRLVLQDITGDYEDLKLEKYKSMIPPCKTGHAGYTYCVNEYYTSYNTPYDEWERKEICHDCVGTEFCLCGQLIMYRYFLKHKPTEKVLCVGSCCIRKINPDLADSMEKGRCYECDDTLRDKTQAYQKLGYCTLECLEISNPTHELLKKCSYPPCRIYLYPIKKLDRNYCAMLCKRKHKELIKELAQLEYKKDYNDPNVNLLCDCEKYYIPYESRIKHKDPICLVCFTIKVKKKPVKQQLLQWMASNKLVHNPKWPIH